MTRAEANCPLIRFLLSELKISEQDIELGMEQTGQVSYLPAILWRDGVLSLAQLDQLFEWVDGNHW